MTVLLESLPFSRNLNNNLRSLLKTDRVSNPASFISDTRVYRRLVSKQDLDFKNLGKIYQSLCNISKFVFPLFLNGRKVLDEIFIFCKYYCT